MTTTATPGPSLPAPPFSLLLPKASTAPDFPADPFSSCGHNKPRYLVCCARAGQPKAWAQAGCRQCPEGLLPRPAPLVSSRHRTFNLNSTSKPQSTHSISPEPWQSPQPPWLGRPLPGPIQGHPHSVPRASATQRALAEHMQPETRFYTWERGKWMRLHRTLLQAGEAVLEESIAHNDT